MEHLKSSNDLLNAERLVSNTIPLLRTLSSPENTYELGLWLRPFLFALTSV